MYCRIYVPVFFDCREDFLGPSGEKTMEKIKVGKIVNAVGLKGEVKVYNYSDSSEIYEITPQLYAGDKLLGIEKVRIQKNMVILKLEGVDDRNAAEAMKGRELFVTEEDLPELEEGEYYIRDLIGMEVVENGVLLGRVTGVLQNTPQDIFEVERENGRQLLIPRVDEFVIDIDMQAQRIEVKLPEGLLEL